MTRILERYGKVCEEWCKVGSFFPKISHTCTMGCKSEKRGGYGKTLTPSSWLKSIVRRYNRETYVVCRKNAWNVIPNTPMYFALYSIPRQSRDSSIKTILYHSAYQCCRSANAPVQTLTMVLLEKVSVGGMKKLHLLECESMCTYNNKSPWYTNHWSAIWFVVAKQLSQIDFFAIKKTEKYLTLAKMKRWFCFHSTL